jgi:hypothetical protein
MTGYPTKRLDLRCSSESEMKLTVAFTSVEKNLIVD